MTLLNYHILLVRPSHVLQDNPSQRPMLLFLNLYSPLSTDSCLLSLLEDPTPLNNLNRILLHRSS